MPAPNGPRKKATTGRNRLTVQNIASKGGNIRTALNRDRQTGVGGSLNQAPKPKIEKKAEGYKPTESLNKLKALRTSSALNRSPSSPPKLTDFASANAPALAASTANTTAMAMLTALQLAQSRRGGGTAVGQGPGGPIMRQLAKGFARAGDDKMARFVRRNPDLMRIWLNQESGMRRNAVSPPNNQGDPNYGYFQFARLEPGARPWLEKFITKGGQGFKANAFQQAVLAARHFDLTPQDVRTYVQQINAGTYKGWG